jgi:hypothetical protein
MSSRTRLMHVHHPKSVQYFNTPLQRGVSEAGAAGHRDHFASLRSRVEDWEAPSPWPSPPVGERVSAEDAGGGPLPPAALARQS